MINMKDNLNQNSAAIRSKAFMYVQQIEKLPFAKEETSEEKINALLKRIQSLDFIKRYALIVHDKDKSSNGGLITPHVHVMLELDKSRAVTKVAKQLEDSVEYFESMTKKYKRYGIENGFAYLTHRTKGAEEKYQYSFEEVKSNFNYAKYMEKLQHRVKMTNKVSNKEFVGKILNDYLTNKVSEIEAKRMVLQYDPLLMQYFLRKLDAVKSTKLEIDADEWFKNRSRDDALKSIIWISGRGGTGKTVLAKMIARNVVKNEYYLSGSDKDYFQDYSGEHCVILDEFRPDKVSYSDLLKMLDNSRFDVSAPSRYHDKKVLADLIIITSPYDPARYYQNDESIRPAVDGFEQLERRITMALNVEKDKISLMKYAGYRTEKIPAPGSGNFKRERPYYKVETSFENYISSIKNIKNYKKEENEITPKILEKLHSFEEKIGRSVGLKLERKS